MIWHLYIAWGVYRIDTRSAGLHVRKESYCCGLTTTGAEGGRPVHIVASQRRGAKSIVTFLGGILP